MIIVDIYTPSTDQSYDLALDENADLSAVMAEVTGMLARRNGNASAVDPQEFVLYNTKNGQPLSLGRTLYENGVRDGDRLILV